MKRFITIASIVDTDLITLTAITGGISIAAFANGVGLPAGIALGGASLFLSIITTAIRKSSKPLRVSREKHDSIKLLAQSKLDNISNIISQAMQDGDISPTEFERVLQEVEKYRKLKADIINQAEAMARQIKKKQPQKLLEQGRKEGMKDFLQKIANTSVPGCQCHLKYEAPPFYSM